MNEGRLYFFPGMDEPRLEPRDDGKTPKYDLYPDGTQRRPRLSVEDAQTRMTVRITAEGEEHTVPSTLLAKPNTSYLGHTSEVFETPWPWEGRWTGNDPHFRRIPSKGGRTGAWRATERAVYEAEIRRLAAIENPGRCAERRRYFDAWCTKRPLRGSTFCDWHTDKSKKPAAAVKAANDELQSKAQKKLQRFKR